MRAVYRAEAGLDGAVREFGHLHHDVGFMRLISSGASFRMTGNDLSRKRTMLAANLPAGRFNPLGFIRARNDDKAGRAIIDCMMNLLCRAGDCSGDPRFRSIAMARADTAMKHFVREDGSCNHIVVFNPDAMAVENIPAGQGYAPDSSWSRGRSWTLYGFTLGCLHTGKTEYLATARKAADSFISQVRGDWAPRCDLRQPEGNPLRDACAGAVAACLRWPGWTSPGRRNASGRR